jgi:hypothetical protein
MEGKLEEGICEYYEGCNMRNMGIRDCTKPAYENCKTYKAWQESLGLGIGAIVDVNVRSADNSTNAK